MYQEKEQAEPSGLNTSCTPCSTFVNPSAFCAEYIPTYRRVAQGLFAYGQFPVTGIARSTARWNMARGLEPVEISLVDGQRRSRGCLSLSWLSELWSALDPTDA